MKSIFILFAVGSLLSSVAASSAISRVASEPPAKVSIIRLGCGVAKYPRDIASFSDTRAYDGLKRALTSSCYLIKHDDDYLLWDTGYPAATRDDPTSPIALPRTVVEQLRQLGLAPGHIDLVAISHPHRDHAGQARDFPTATMLIGTPDWTDVTAKEPPPLVDPKLLAHWISGGGMVRLVRADEDVFGDGTVTMLGTPGHTPGHQSLLVKLKMRGYVLLTGDLAHITANYVSNGVPSFNTDRADTLASIDRIKKMAANLKATVIIGHEPADIAKLPAFPEAAE